MKTLTGCSKALLLLMLCKSPVWAADCDGLSFSECDTQQQLIQDYTAKLSSQPLIEVMDALERDIMLNPRWAGLAKLYGRLVNSVDRQEAGLRSERTNLETESAENWQYQRELQIKEGYSSNFNRAPLSSSFVLTLPNNPLLVQLDPKYQAQAGMGTDIQGEIKASKSISQRLDWQLSANGQVRQTEFDGYANYQNAALSSSWIRKNAGHSADIAVLGGNVMHYDNDVKIYLTQAQLKRLWHFNQQCDAWAGADGYWQKGEQVANLSGVYAGASTGIRCDRNGYAYQFTASSGEDFALENRLGGGQWRSRVAGQVILPTEQWLQGSAIKLTMAGTYSQDEQAYSQLLNNNAIRNYRRYEAGLEYEFLLSQQWKNIKAITSLQWQKQDSNINLFRSEVYEAWLGFKWKW